LVNMERATLKSKAKDVLRSSYWPAFVVALIAMLVSGEAWSLSRSFESMVTTASGGGFNVHYAVGDAGRWLNNVSAGMSSNAMAVAAISVLAVFILAVMIGLALGILFYVFVGARIEVGAKRYFIRSSFVEDEKIGTIGFAFQSGYGNVSKVMFLRRLYVWLWMLVPVAGWAIAIYKSYGYRMVPYILADNPHMDSQRALALSTRMMHGYRMELFVLELSFIGWHLLCALTFGIGRLFLAPYIDATEAQFYMALSGMAVESGLVSREEMNLPVIAEPVAPLYPN